MKMVRESGVFEQLDEEANETIRKVVREVTASHAGQPRDAVYAHLAERLAAEGIEPDETEFRKVVDEISAGAATD